MSDGRDGLEAEVRAIRRAVQEVAARVERLEVLAGRGAPEAPPIAAAARPTAPAGERPAVHPDVLRAVPLIGRLLLVLAGAYLLRAVTDGGQVRADVGAAAGLLFALSFLEAARRAARAGKALSAAFHALGTSLVAYPLLYESATRFGLVHPAAATGLAGAVTAVAFAIAARHRAYGVAAASCAGGAFCAAALFFTPGGMVAAGALLVGMGTVAPWAARPRGWNLLAWSAGLAADAAALGLTYAALGPQAAVPAAAAMAVAVAFVALHLGEVSVRLLRRRGGPTAFDAWQTALVLATGLRGALLVAADSGAWGTGIGAGTVAAAAVLYAVAFGLIKREERAPFLFLTTVALVLALVGSGRLLAAPALPWAVLGLAAAWLGSRVGRTTLALHGAVYAAAAALASGLLACAWAAWSAPAAAPWPGLTPVAWVALAAVGLCAWFPARPGNPYWRAFAVLPEVASFALLLVAGGGALLGLLAPLLAGAPGPGADAALLAAVRTGMIAAATFACALVAREGRLRRAAWIVWPLLLAGGAKLAAEDLAHGRPATLAASFLLYGSAVILGPRLARLRAEKDAPPREDAAR